MNRTGKALSKADADGLPQTKFCCRVWLVLKQVRTNRSLFPVNLNRLSQASGGTVKWNDAVKKKHLINKETFN